jgi:uncharacterized repeat protein (TIGR01451 family)
MKTTFRFLALSLMLVAGARLEAQTTKSPLAVSVANQTAAAEAARGAIRRDTTLHAGDVLRYTLTFSNPVERNIRGVKLENPIPAGLKLVAGSARASRADAALEFSADAGKTWAAQPTEVVMVDGREVRRPISADRFTHVRWTVAGTVAPKATVVASFDTRFATAPDAPGVAADPAARKGGR